LQKKEKLPVVKRELLNALSMYTLPKLNLPEATLKLKEENGIQSVWDLVRKKYVKLDPEEWVRQQMIHYLIDHKQYPLGLMSVEKTIEVNGLKKRTDIVIHDTYGSPKMIIELKASKVPINNEVFMQIAGYNLKLQVDYLLLSNGIEHYCFYLNKEKKEMESLASIPGYNELNSTKN